METLAILHNHGLGVSPNHEITHHEKVWDDSITDTTFYTPVGSMVRKLNAQDKVSFLNDPTYYDFPDGKDTGATIPISRYPDTDMAELSQAVRRDSEQVEAEIKKEIKRQSKKAVETQQPVSTDSPQPSSDQ